MIEVWAGAVLGTFLPLMTLVVAWFAGMPGSYLLRFFAGFCAVANGMYFGAGAVNRVGDPAELLHHGTSLWVILLFGLATVTLGMALWHRQGLRFGLGEAKGKVEPRVAYAVLSLLILVAVVEVLINSR